MLGPLHHHLRREPRLLLLLALICGALWGFGVLADEVAENETEAFDTAILLFFRAPDSPDQTIGPAWLRQAAVDITALGGYPVLAVISAVAAGYLLLAGRRGGALLVVVSAVGGTVITSALKALFDRARPDLVPHLVEVQTLSFPSGHSTLSAVVYLTLGVLLAAVHKGRRMKVYILGWAVALAVLVGLSRVYLGVHWPTDVLGGWSVGAAWALLCWTIAEALERRRSRRAATPGEASGGAGSETG